MMASFGLVRLFGLWASSMLSRKARFSARNEMTPLGKRMVSEELSQCLPAVGNIGL